MKLETILTQTCDNGSTITLSADENNNLYVNDQLIVTKNVVQLDGFVNFSIFIGGVSTFGLLLLEIYRLFRLQ